MVNTVEINEAEKKHKYIEMLKNDIELMEKIKNLIKKAKVYEVKLKEPLKKECEFKPKYDPPTFLSLIPFVSIIKISLSMAVLFGMINYLFYTEIVSIFIPKILFSFFRDHYFIGPFIIPFSISIMVYSLCVLLTIKQSKKEYKKTYEERVLVINNKNKLIKEYNDKFQQRKLEQDQIKLNLTLIYKNIDEYKIRLQNQYTLKKMYNPIYENQELTYYILNLLTSGRADTLKEAINLYEEEKRHNERMDAIKQVEYQQHMLSNEVASAKRCAIESAQKSMEAANGARVAAENARVAADRARIEAESNRY